MKNIMIKAAGNGHEIWFGASEIFAEYLRSSEAVEEVKTFKGGEVPLEELPQDVREDVMGTMKYYDACHVVYYGGEFHAAAGYGIMAHYPTDFCVVGDYRSEDFYSAEERAVFYKELAKMNFY